MTTLQRTAESRNARSRRAILALLLTALSLLTTALGCDFLVNDGTPAAPSDPPPPPNPRPGSRSGVGDTHARSLSAVPRQELGDRRLPHG